MERAASERGGRPRAAVGLGMAVALLLVAGGIAAVTRSGSPGPTPTDAISLIASSPDAARSAGTARVTVTSVTEAEGQAFSFNMAGVGDFASGASAFTADFDVAGQRFGFEVRTDGEQAWIAVPEAQRAATAGKAWVVIPVAALTGGDQQFDLESQFAYLDALVAAEDTEMVGEEDVNGVSTTRYRTTIDLEALPEGNGIPPAQLQQLRDVGLTSFPTEVWLDEDGLPLRQVITFAVSGVTSTTTIELSDFGTPLDFVLPTPEESFPIADLQTLTSMVFTPAG